MNRKVLVNNVFTKFFLLIGVYGNILTVLPKAFFQRAFIENLARVFRLSPIIFCSTTMSKVTRLSKSIIRLVMPIVLLVVVAAVVSGIWLAHDVSLPQDQGHVISLEKYSQLSSRAAQVTEETWPARDGSSIKGWVLRGSPNMPAVILLHRYGANRSHELNLGVKLNEATNFTVVMPDARGHGAQPSVPACTFGGCETDDVLATIEWVKTLKSPENFQLVGGGIGVYGIEMGALSALSAAAASPDVRAIAVDSVPADSDAMIGSVIARRFPFASSITEKLGQYGSRGYFLDGCYRNASSCEVARTLATRSVLLLAGSDSQDFQQSTARLGKCFPNSTKMDSKTDLSPSGMGILSASIEAAESYDQRVIDFFRNSFDTPPPVAMAIREER